MTSYNYGPLPSNLVIMTSLVKTHVLLGFGLKKQSPGIGNMAFLFTALLKL